MKILIISVGKKHDETIKGAILEFEKRINVHFSLDWQIIPSDSKEGEGKKIKNSFKDGDFVIVLDENGKELNTKEFAQNLEKHISSGVKRLVFVIGGAYGLHSEVLLSASFTWSLSRLTFPHQVVRLILIEQIYRAISIINGGKYHHE